MSIQKFVIACGTAFMLLCGVLMGVNNYDTIEKYLSRLDKAEVCNTVETAKPQTEIYNLISDHFNSALPDGKTQKKAIVLGYDGCRADLLSAKDETNSAIIKLQNEGGHTDLSYCGGVNYPALNTQDTSTAPGWCSMLTGQWADVHGIYKNDVPKSNDHLTLLTTLVQNKLAKKSAFYVSWKGHFAREGATYAPEKQFCEDNGLPVKFECSKDDAGTANCIMSDLKDPNCSDFIFSTLEYTDHFGHATGYNLENPIYVQGFYDAEKVGSQAIDTIKNRPTYNNEDWLIIITSDHGGYNMCHGLYTIQERITFITTNK